MFAVTVTEHAPTEDKTDINTYHLTLSTMTDVTNFLSDQDANFTIWLNVSITQIPIERAPANGNPGVYPPDRGSLNSSPNL